MSQQTTAIGRRPSRSVWRRAGMAVRRDWQLWVLLLPALAFFIVFCYFPMYGVQIAFRDYKAAFGITGSKWVGLKFFEMNVELEKLLNRPVDLVIDGDLLPYAEKTANRDKVLVYARA